MKISIENFDGPFQKIHINRILWIEDLRILKTTFEFAEMLSDQIRKRIAELNQRSLKHSPLESVDGTDEDLPQGEAENHAQNSVYASAQDARRNLAIDEAEGGHEVHTEFGSFLLIDQPFDAWIPGNGKAFLEKYVHRLQSLETPPEDRHDSFHPLVDAGPNDLIYLDIETTGLSPGTPLFLIGALIYEDHTLKVRQMLARDYTEEAALLSYFADLLEKAGVVFSFNGKAYDLPYIRDRSLYLGVPFRLRQPHIDLLHIARRRWRESLPNCKLLTLERYICLRTRQGDIPGWEIPDAYHRFVQTGNATQMRDILYHNALDLITMAEVMLFILEDRRL